MTRKTPTTEAPANPLPTLTPEALQALIEEEVSASRKLMAEQMAEIAELKAAKPQAANGQSTKSAENEWKTIKAFKKLGVTAKPRVDTFTFNIWVSKGFRPVEGSKAVRVNNLRLFHKSQVRPLSSEEKQAMQTELDKAVAANKAKIVSITEAHPQ